ncbi:hypothetical protein VH567_15565 [Sphingomonas sp. 4RDLI-65]|uniref:hypothetical protein n=1 Tax=Sphingomonas sp. 4RDLI-65 TaxID=3111641 RepID=UPI003C16E748
MPRQIAIRLGTEGKAQVVADLDAIGTTGDAAFNRLAKSAMKAGRDADTAMEFANKQASKLAALLPGLNPTKLDMAAGVRDNIGKSAESSAAIFEAAYAKMEARAIALRVAIDPVYGAQQRFDREMVEARTLISAGAISLDDYVAKLRQEQAALDAVSVKHGLVTGKTGQQRQSYMMLGQQMQDFSVQVANGGSIATAFSQQIGQAAFAVQGMGGKLAAVGTFLTSGWGIAATVALTLFAPLVAKILEGGNALEKETKELKDNAEKAGVASRAKEAFSKTEVAARADIAALTEELNKQNASLRTNAEQLNIRAKQSLQTLTASRATLTQELEVARAARTAAMRSGSQGSEVNVGTASARIAELEARLKVLNKSITEGEVDVQRTRVGLAAEAAKRMADPIAQINRKYDEQGRAAQAAADKSAKGHNVVTSALTRQLGQIEINRAAAVKAEHDKQSALQRTAKVDKETVTAAQVARLLRSELPGVQVTSTTGGQHVKNSYHYRNQAVDFVPKGGMSSMSKDDVRKIFTARGIDVVELLGPGDKGHSDHFHVAWTKGKLALDDFNDAAKRTKDAQRELDKANKELDSDLEDVVNRFDPARQGADQYAASLAKIAVLRGKGKITADQSAEYIFAAMREDQAREDAARAITIKNLFGDVGDPIGDAIARNDADAEVKRAAFDAEQERRQRVQTNGIRTIADLYSTAMSGGTRSLFQSFKAMGINAITELAAKWTMSQIGKLAGSGGFIGSLATLISGGKAAAPTTSVPKLASGTEYWSGGEALLGEHGPEKAWLPKGTRVTPAGATRRMADDQPRGGVTHNYFNGNLLTPEFWQQIQAGDANAAMQGAAGGAAMGQADAQAAGMKRLGRFR